MTATTISKSIQFNNAGVACFRCHPKKAWELFKGALEVKLALERSMNTHLPAKLPLYENLSSTNSYVNRAQAILDEVDEEEISTNDDNVEMTLEEVEESRTLLSSTIYKQFGDELGDIFYTPFLFSKPFLISDNEVLSPYGRARSTSAIVIFNLALVEHLFNRTSQQAVSLYELSTSLMVGRHVNELGIALVNNIGVWCWENDDMDAAQRCMDHLWRILRNPACQHLIDSNEKSSILRNICSILTPRGTASPAA